MKKIFTFGEIMLRISPVYKEEKIIQTNIFRIEPGGSEANVAIALANLGNTVAYITKLPENELGAIVLRYLRKHNIDTSFISMDTKRLGLYWTEQGIGPRASKVLYDREYSSFFSMQKKDFQWSDMKKDMIWFHTSGISPAVSENVYSVLQNVLPQIEKNIPISIDLNYRNTLWRWTKNKTHMNRIMSNLCSNATLLCANETDIQNSLGIPSEKNIKNKIEFYRDLSNQVFQKMPRLQYLAISIREALSASENIWTGVLFYKTHNDIRYVKGIEYRLSNIVDRIGAGDSFCAGIIHGLLHTSYSPQDTIDVAVTLSGLKHTIRGDVAQFSIEEIEHTRKTQGTGNIIR